MIFPIPPSLPCSLPFPSTLCPKALSSRSFPHGAAPRAPKPAVCPPSGCFLSRASASPPVSLKPREELVLPCLFWFPTFGPRPQGPPDTRPASKHRTFRREYGKAAVSPRKSLLSATQPQSRESGRTAGHLVHPPASLPARPWGCSAPTHGSGPVDPPRQGYVRELGASLHRHANPATAGWLFRPVCLWGFVPLHQLPALLAASTFSRLRVPLEFAESNGAPSGQESEPLVSASAGRGRLALHPSSPACLPPDGGDPLSGRPTPSGSRRRDEVREASLLLPTERKSFPGEVSSRGIFRVFRQPQCPMS